MQITRRQFTSGSLGFALGAPLCRPAWAQAAVPQGTLDAIKTYAEAHVRHFGLPGLTLGLSTPSGFSAVMNFGYANAESRLPIGPDTLFQIGSISKSFTATLLHQYAAERRLNLTDSVTELLPALSLPSGNRITLQHLLNHTAGLPDDAPIFPIGGLWTGFAPGAHWSYSNTGYAILGMVAERVGGKPLDRLLEERLFTPLGMLKTRGAIVASDRQRYAQGYEAAHGDAPYLRGLPLAPAAWVDVTTGEGSIGSTADDMIRYLRALSGAAYGRGGLGLGPQQGLAFIRHVVPSDTPAMTYGNGLMHVASEGRSYLHHTGGMVSFSSSFHLDIASGAAAFASSTLSGFAEYRPRLLTQFAVDALTNGSLGKAPPRPPSLDIALTHPTAAYVGHYSGPDGAFEIRPGMPLTIVAKGESAPLEYWGGEVFRTRHPAFRTFSFMFERTKGIFTGASWGASTYRKDGAIGTTRSSDPALARLAGRYVNDSPWWGVMRVVERGGELWIGTETPLARIADNLWRVGPESWSPERLSFADNIDGRPQTLIFSGNRFARHDI